MKYKLSQRVRKGFKHRKVLLNILTLIAKLGLEIRPYYVFREGLFDRESKESGPEFNEYETAFLGPADIKNLDGIEGRKASDQSLRIRLEKG